MFYIQWLGFIMERFLDAKFNEVRRARLMFSLYTLNSKLQTNRGPDFRIKDYRTKGLK
jgi:hypothetical protein